MTKYCKIFGWVIQFSFDKSGHWITCKKNYKNEHLFAFTKVTIQDEFTAYRLTIMWFSIAFIK